MLEITHSHLKSFFVGVHSDCRGGQIQGGMCQLESGDYCQSTERDNTIKPNFQYYTKCTTGPTNPFHGAISFDNIGLAWVAIFLVISLEGWTDVMYFVQDAHSFWNWIYFVCLIVVS